MAKFRLPSCGALLVATASMGCGSEAPSHSEDAAVHPSDVAVEVGVPAGSDGLGFAPLAEGGELRLQTFGQGGTHVLLGVRCVGFGSRAFVGISIRNLETGAIALTNPPAHPQLLYCHDESVCDLVPLLAATSGLTEPGAERDGVRVLLTATASNEAGAQAEASVEAVLSTADL